MADAYPLLKALIKMVAGFQQKTLHHGKHLMVENPSQRFLRVSFLPTLPCHKYHQRRRFYKSCLYARNPFHCRDIDRFYIACWRKISGKQLKKILITFHQYEFPYARLRQRAKFGQNAGYSRRRGIIKILNIVVCLSSEKFFKFGVNSPFQISV